MTLLETRQLSTTLSTSGDGAVRIIDGVSLTVDARETVGIVGESGSGKSVLVRSIMGLLPATARIEGQVLFEGVEIHALPPRERRRLWGAKIAMVFQDPMTSLNPVRKVGHQITDPLRQHLGMSRSEAAARAVELFDLVRIPEAARRLGQYPHELSGGMRQRVGIAIALSCRPRLLIADEPTTALDVTVQREILDLLASVQRELDMSMILISHDLAVVSGRTDRIMVMYAGKIVEAAATREFFTGAHHPYAHALIGTAPSMSAVSHARMPTIAGRPPNLAALPTGCRFAPRCPDAQPRCAAEEPELTVASDGRRSRACWFPLDEPSIRPAPQREPT